MKQLSVYMFLLWRNKGGQIEKSTEFYCCLLKCVYGTHKEHGEKVNDVLEEAWPWSHLYSSGICIQWERRAWESYFYALLYISHLSIRHSVGSFDFRHTIKMFIMNLLGDNCWKDFWHFKFNCAFSLCFKQYTELSRPFSVLRDISPVILSVLGVI